MLILYLATLITASYCALKMLLPEMLKPVQPKVVRGPSPSEFFQPGPSNSKIERFEILLAEKNKNIQLLQRELKFSHAQIHNFDKIKSLLEEEIQRLREQNRIFRSELGMPTVQPKENLIT